MEDWLGHWFRTSFQKQFRVEFYSLSCQEMVILCATKEIFGVFMPSASINDSNDDISSCSSWVADDFRFLYSAGWVPV